MYKYFFMLLFFSFISFAGNIEVINSTGLRGEFYYEYHNHNFFNPESITLKAYNEDYIKISKWIGAGFRALNNPNIHVRCPDITDPENINQIIFEMKGEAIECHVNKLLPLTHESGIINLSNKTKKDLEIGYVYSYLPSHGSVTLSDKESKDITAAETISITATYYDDNKAIIVCSDITITSNINIIFSKHHDGNTVIESSNSYVQRQVLQKAKVIKATNDRIKPVKAYINNSLLKYGKPILVIGATSTDDIPKNRRHILANNDIKDFNDDRNLYLDFLQEDSLAIIAKHFPNTFEEIYFDRDVLNYMGWSRCELGYKNFGVEDIKLIKNMLIPGGKFYMPRQIILSEDNVNIHSLEDFIKENAKLVASDDLVYEMFLVDKSLNYKLDQFDENKQEWYEIDYEESLRRRKVKDDIYNYLLKNNVERILSLVFGVDKVKHMKNAILSIRDMEVPDLFIATK